MLILKAAADGHIPMPATEAAFRVNSRGTGHTTMRRLLGCPAANGRFASIAEIHSAPNDEMTFFLCSSGAAGCACVLPLLSIAWFASRALDSHRRHSSPWKNREQGISLLIARPLTNLSDSAICRRRCPRAVTTRLVRCGATKHRTPHEPQD